MRVLLMITAAACILLPPASASPHIWHVPNEAPTIQAGIDSAALGDTVLVACGTYYEQDIVLKEGVCLLSETGDPTCVTVDAQGQGRVLYADGLSNATRVEGFTVTGGHAGGIGLASHGGGMICLNGSSPALGNVDFRENHAERDGGGVHCRDQSSPTFTECLFSGNSTAPDGDGGAIYCRVESSPELTGCTVVGNWATVGGGIRCYNSCSPVLTGVTIAGNDAYRGGGILLASNCASTMENVIVWGNCASELGDEIYLADAGSSISFRCSDVDSSEIEGPGSVSWTWGNIHTDPLFCEPAPCWNAPTTDGNYYLHACSPCLNPSGCGLVGSLPQGDCPRTLHILPDGSGDAPTIAGGIDAACEGDTVLVAPGTYYEHDIVMKSGIRLVGETGRAGEVIIDAQSLGRVFLCNNLESTTLMEGLTFTGGAGLEGAGLALSLSSPRIVNCIFSDNSANYGAGIACNNTSSPTVTSCTFSNNTAYYGAGMLVVNESSSELSYCTFSGNNATSTGGGAIFCDEGTLSLHGCTFSENEGVSYGGGLWMFDSTVSLTECVFDGNSSNQGGGLQSYENSTITVTSCTFYGNHATMGSAMDLGPNSTATVENTIAAFSTAGVPLSCNDPSASYGLSCCDIYGNTSDDWVGCIADQLGENGNISEDPLFCGPEAGDFHLDTASPCLDAPECGLMGVLGEGCTGFRTEVTENEGRTTAGLHLGPAVPNPSNPMTEISYGLPAGSGGSRVILRVYDPLGRVVRTLVDGPQGAGVHTVTWDGLDGAGTTAASGVYFYRLTWNGESRTQRLILVR